jgi:hypothetical protein
MLVSCLFIDAEDGRDMFLRNVGWLSTDYTALYPRRLNSSLINNMHIPVILLKIKERILRDLQAFKELGYNSIVFI